MITAILLLALMQPQDSRAGARFCTGHDYGSGADREAHAG